MKRCLYSFRKKPRPHKTIEILERIQTPMSIMLPHFINRNFLFFFVFILTTYKLHYYLMVIIIIVIVIIIIIIDVLCFTLLHISYYFISSCVSTVIILNHSSLLQECNVIVFVLMIVIHLTNEKRCDMCLNCHCTV